MNGYLNNILLALVWAALTGSFTLPNFALGLLLGALALYLVREQLARGAESLSAAGEICRCCAFRLRAGSLGLARRDGWCCRRKMELRAGHLCLSAEGRPRFRDHACSPI